MNNITNIGVNQMNKMNNITNIGVNQIFLKWTKNGRGRQQTSQYSKGIKSPSN
jgi:hypothetical protein